MPQREFLPQSFRARELYGDDWLNGEPVIVSSLRGSVLLLFFWDFAGPSSIAWMPYAIAWARKYSTFDLAVAGIHTPRFSFERNHEAVEGAVKDLGLPFPVMIDNDGVAASHYGVRTFPAFAAVDRSGFIRGIFEGDTGNIAAERLVQGLLHETGPGGELPELMEPLRLQDRESAVCFHATPELEVGYLRGSLGNVEGYSPESVVEYADPGIYLDGRVYVDGPWSNGRESLRLDASNAGEIILVYQGVDVNGVLGIPPGGTHGITVRQDGLYLTAENRGVHIHFDAEGRSILEIDHSGCFNIVKNPEFGEHILRLSADRDGLEAYAFSFSTDVIPEMVERN